MLLRHYSPVFLWICRLYADVKLLILELFQKMENVEPYAELIAKYKVLREDSEWTYKYVNVYIYIRNLSNLACIALIHPLTLSYNQGVSRRIEELASAETLDINEWHLFIKSFENNAYIRWVSMPLFYFVIKMILIVFKSHSTNRVNLSSECMISMLSTDLSFVQNFGNLKLDQGVIAERANISWIIFSLCRILITVDTEHRFEPVLQR